MKVLLVLFALFTSNLFAANYKAKKYVKKTDGTKVNCLKDKGRFRNRFGAYRFTVSSIQSIKKDNKEYLQVFGEFRYFHCKYVTVNGKDYGYLSPYDLDEIYEFDHLRLDNKWHKINVHIEKAEMIVFQDAVYKVIARSPLQMNHKQSVRLDIPVSELKFDLSETAPPVVKGRLDFSMSAHFVFADPKTGKSGKKFTSFGDYRLHFTAEKVQSTSKISERWQFTIKK